jgi:hypothetical protein
MAPAGRQRSHLEAATFTSAISRRIFCSCSVTHCSCSSTSRLAASRAPTPRQCTMSAWATDTTPLVWTGDDQTSATSHAIDRDFSDYLFPRSRQSTRGYPRLRPGSRAGLIPTAHQGQQSWSTAPDEIVGTHAFAPRVTYAPRGRLRALVSTNSPSTSPIVRS